VKQANDAAYSYSDYVYFIRDTSTGSCYRNANDTRIQHGVLTGVFYMAIRVEKYGEKLKYVALEVKTKNKWGEPIFEAIPTKDRPNGTLSNQDSWGPYCAMRGDRVELTEAAWSFFAGITKALYEVANRISMIEDKEMLLAGIERQQFLLVAPDAQ